MSLQQQQQQQVLLLLLFRCRCLWCEVFVPRWRVGLEEVEWSLVLGDPGVGAWPVAPASSGATGLALQCGAAALAGSVKAQFHHYSN